MCIRTSLGDGDGDQGCRPEWYHPQEAVEKGATTVRERCRDRRIRRKPLPYGRGSTLIRVLQHAAKRGAETSVAAHWPGELWRGCKTAIPSRRRWHCQNRTKCDPARPDRQPERLQEISRGSSAVKPPGNASRGIAPRQGCQKCGARRQPVSRETSRRIQFCARWSISISSSRNGLTLWCSAWLAMYCPTAPCAVGLTVRVEGRDWP